MSNVCEDNIVVDDDYSPRPCQFCGGPATEMVNLCVYEHSFSLVDQEWIDGDEVKDLRTWYVCDDCRDDVEYPEVRIVDDPSD